MDQVLLFVFFLIAVVKSVPEDTKEYLTMGPFPATETMRGITFDLPDPDKTVLISSIDDWQLLDDEFSPYTDDQLLLHHLVVSRNGNDLDACLHVGSSRETYGPIDLKDPYRLVIKPSDKCQVFELMPFRQQNDIQQYYLRYSVTYRVYDSAQPSVRPIKMLLVPTIGRVSNVKHGALEPFETVEKFTFGFMALETMHILRVQGHLHQGGLNISISDGLGRRSFCDMHAKYSEELCVYQCADVCPYDHTQKWGKYIGTTSCETEKRVYFGTPFIGTAYYDSTCSWEEIMAFVYMIFWNGKEFGHH